MAEATGEIKVAATDTAQDRKLKMGENRPWLTLPLIPTSHLHTGLTEAGDTGAWRGHPSSPRLDSRQTGPRLANQPSHIMCSMPTNRLWVTWFSAPCEPPGLILFYLFKWEKVLSSAHLLQPKSHLFPPQQKPTKAFSSPLLQTFHALTGLRGFQNSSFQ